MNERVLPYELTFEPVTIPPKQHAVVQARPEGLFRCGQIVAKESKPGSTRVLALFGNNKSLFPPNPNGIPTALFGEKSLGSGVLLDTCHPNFPMTFIVANDSDEEVTWEAMMIGRTVK